MSRFGDLMQNFIMSNPKRAIWFMTTMPASFWEKKSSRMALGTLHDAGGKVSGYRDFLKQHNITLSTINTIEDYKKMVPITSKKNFLYKYPISSLLGENFKEIFGICFSSGSTGIPTPFLYRRKIFFSAFQGWLSWLDYIWDIASYGISTLFINAAPLGIWSFGYTTNLLIGRILDKYDITLVTPGLDSKTTVKIIKEIGKNYSQVVINTIPSFLREILEEGEKQEIKWEKLNVKLQLGGEYLSEDFREYIFSKIDPKERKIWRILDIIAAGDTGLLGVSFPISQIIQKIANEDENLRSMLLKEKSPFFSLFQWNPLSVFLEEKEGHLLVTSNVSSIPIIRYNLGDLGKIISFHEMEKILKSCGYTISDLLRKMGWQKGYFSWPFLVYHGRADDIVTIFSGAKISPANLLPLLTDPEAKEIKSFKLTTVTEKDFNIRLEVYLELNPNFAFIDQELVDLEKKYQKLVHRWLLKTNIDYQDAYRIAPDKVFPRVKIFHSGEGPFKKDISRPKPRFII